MKSTNYKLVVQFKALSLQEMEDLSLSSLLRFIICFFLVFVEMFTFSEVVLFLDIYLTNIFPLLLYISLLLFCLFLLFLNDFNNSLFISFKNISISFGLFCSSLGFHVCVSRDSVFLRFSISSSFDVGCFVNIYEAFYFKYHYKQVAVTWVCFSIFYIFFKGKFH